MKEEKMRDLMIEYIDGKLSGELKDFVAKHIEKDEMNKQYFEELRETMELLESDRDLEPAPGMKQDFLQALDREIAMTQKSKERKLVPFPVWKVAAAIAMVLSGVFIGTWLIKDNTKDQQLAELKKEMESTKQMVLQSLNENPSASARVQGINVVFNDVRVDDEVISALIRTMNADENTNVRLAAVRALAKFVDEPKVRKALIYSMEKQSDPVVQITLINLMVDLKQKGAIHPLQKVINSDSTSETVRDEAHMAVFKLS